MALVAVFLIGSSTTAQSALLRLTICATSCIAESKIFCYLQRTSTHLSAYYQWAALRTRTIASHRRLPHQCAHWFAMTTKISYKKSVPGGTLFCYSSSDLAKSNRVDFSASPISLPSIQSANCFPVIVSFSKRNSTIFFILSASLVRI